jgi:uncharacterized protein involved in exopolysaccharide biosynthesis
MMVNNVDNSESSNTEITLKEVFNHAYSAFRYLKSKWFKVLFFVIVGGVLGLAYAIYKKPVYTAVCTFVLEDGGKGNPLGQYAGLASVAGLDISGGGGLFQGDNIIELYKSRSMIEKTLLTETIINNKKQLLIDIYAEANGLRKQWKLNNHINAITFLGDPGKFNRQQDSIISDIVNNFNRSSLAVTRPDKKLSIIDVEFTSKDELFSKEFTNKLVGNVNEFYVQTKIKKNYQNVQVLQHQADSVKSSLNFSIRGVASAIDAAPNANPLQVSLHVPSQRKQVDVQASTAVYSEIVKNLEVAKITLRQERPLIQIIDSPVLPLKKTRLSKSFAVLVGGFIAFLISSIYLLNKRPVKAGVNN